MDSDSGEGTPAGRGLSFGRVVLVFACALFFAQLGRDGARAASIWVLDPQALNTVSVNRPGRLSLDDDCGGPSVFDVTSCHPKWERSRDRLTSVAAAPIFTNSRMLAQRSAFTVMGDSFAPLDEQFEGRLVSEGHLTELLLTPETFEDAGQYLRTAGITAFTFYPDLYGLGLKHRIGFSSQLRDLARFYPDEVADL